MHFVDKNNGELYKLIMEVIQTEITIVLDNKKESITLQRLIDKSGFGEAGTVALLNKLELMGIVKTKRKKADWLISKEVDLHPDVFEEILFVPSSLLTYVTDSFIDDLKTYNSNAIHKKNSAKEINSLVKSIKSLSKTRFFKKYFYGKIIEYWRYSTLSGLEQIILELLRKPLIEQKSVENKEEFNLLAEASKKMKDVGYYDTELLEVERYFFMTSQQKKLLGVVKSLIDNQAVKEVNSPSLALVRLKVAKEEILKSAEKISITKEQAAKQLQELEYLNEIYKVKGDYYKLSINLPELKWLK
ncbi:MAG: hypothetical protein WC652_07135 [archaeon]